MPHQYRITVEKMDGDTPVQALRFDATNHDDFFAILERANGRLGFSDEQTKNFIIGLKLFGEVITAERKHPLFSEIGPQLKLFMKKLKSAN
ncbi:DUF3861 domain-containing protein [Shewanella dokdonensis]|uniref:DUF3861 domain-containing protein n=1 Tax=Shewanella dokdonensis TaxID=712036 RepID=A0ABX8DH59_9GAMM|nr:DUF3861 domain-containing protein [Shewanella dokdonensis]MCL1074426.1 DUF3861 domain-containing protein [Shewanella dokdonensis]QVK24094.1 DUF3861 domain-containing protein [Shewanella dokdonensis]